MRRRGEGRLGLRASRAGSLDDVVGRQLQRRQLGFVRGDPLEPLGGFVVGPVLVVSLVVGDAASVLIVIRFGGDGRLTVAAYGAERLALGALYLGRIGAAAPLQVEVLFNRVVKKTHKGYSPADTLAVSGWALTVRFLPPCLAI